MDFPFEQYLSPQTPKEARVLEELEQLLQRCESAGIARGEASAVLQSYLFFLGRKHEHDERQRTLQEELAQLPTLTDDAFAAQGAPSPAA